MTTRTDNTDPRSRTAKQPAPPASGRSAGRDRLVAVMYIDAAITGANGVAYLAGASLLAGLLGPAPAVLIGIGAFLTVYALVVALIGRGRPISFAAVRAAALLNLAWVAASLVVAAGGLIDLTGWGRLWAVAQAMVVLAFAVVQLAGIRRR
ncbi:hypothetical protein [Millisia brevis]|uniref:hypothetical protein n=1 Tax=Millisia brevis TaxID=264148 RepID=UPI00082CFF63|nr:hypothetical protein [Millisia brevis]